MGLYAGSGCCVPTMIVSFVRKDSQTWSVGPGGDQSDQEGSSRLDILRRPLVTIETETTYFETDLNSPSSVVRCRGGKAACKQR